jgi:hypothetical protein
MSYIDLVIHFESTSAGESRIRVLDSPAGEGVGGSLELLPTDNIAAFAALASARIASDEAELFAVGSRLFDSMFSGVVGELYYRSLGQLQASNEGLRIVIRIDPADSHLRFLQNLPWELLANRQTREFLALSQKHSIVRRLQVPKPIPRLSFELPLQVLLVVASPYGVPFVGLEQEERLILEILNDSLDVKVSSVHNPTLQTLREQLLNNNYHVLHFVGHGGVDRDTGEGFIVLDDQSGQAMSTSGRRLSEGLSGIETLRLVVLSACDTARSASLDQSNPFSSVAGALVLAGVPSVLAMQFPISDKGAAAFSSALYRSLANGNSIDRAVAVGRAALRSAAENNLGEWAAPALFSRMSGDEKLISRQEGGLEGHDDLGAKDQGASLQIEAADISVGRDVVVNEVGYKGAESHTGIMLRQLEMSYEEARRDAKIWSISSVAAAGLGLSLVVVAISGWAMQIVELSAVSGFLGAVSGAISGLFFRNWKQSSGRLSSMIRALEDLRKLDFAQSVAHSMDTAQARDEAKAIIIQGIVDGFSKERPSQGSDS